MMNNHTRITWISSIVCVVLWIIGCSEDTDPVGLLRLESPIINNITTNILRIQKSLNTRTENLELETASQENNGTFSIHRAVAFRVSQICSQVWDNGVFYSFHIERVESGWNIEGTRELFVDVLGIPAELVIIPPDATPSNDLSLEDSWYEITFTNGRSLVFQGTEKIYHEPYLTLRDEYLSGNDEVTADMVEQERQKVEQTLRTLPFTDKFIITAQN